MSDVGPVAAVHNPLQAGHAFTSTLRRVRRGHRRFATTRRHHNGLVGQFLEQRVIVRTN